MRRIWLGGTFIFFWIQELAYLTQEWRKALSIAMNKSVGWKIKILKQNALKTV